MIDFGFSFSLFYATRNGFGLHSSDIPPEDKDALNKANYAFTVLYVCFEFLTAGSVGFLTTTF